MAWKETDRILERFRFISEFEKGSCSMARLCREFDISRKCGYKWLERYEKEGLSGLEDRSHACIHHPNAVNEEVVRLVLKLRDGPYTPGPKKIVADMKRLYPQLACPAVSTVGEILGRHGRIVERRRRRIWPKTKGLAGEEKANRTWSIDFKGWWRTGNGVKFHPLTLCDHATRFLLRCHGLDQCGFDQVKPVLESAFLEFGLPEIMRSDNGPPFGSPGPGGLSRLSIWLIELGIVPDHIRPGCPQDNGRHERTHLTVQQHVASNPQANARKQQRELDRLRDYFNWDRPHEALEQQTPGSLYEASPREYPIRLRQPQYSESMQKRSVSCDGQIRWNSGKIYVTRTLEGHTVGLEQSDERYWTMYFFDYPLALLDIKRLKLLPLPKRSAAVEMTS